MQNLKKNFLKPSMKKTQMLQKWNVIREVDT